MDRLFEIMAKDMEITPYEGEPEASYIYRITFSALGLWSLTYARSQTQEIRGISKNAQSQLLHNLTEEYLRLCPAVRPFFSGSRIDIAVFIRNIYEQTGYLLTSDTNYNVLNNGADSIRVSDTDNLYLGIPSEKFNVNGLGVHCSHPYNEVLIQDFLIRDNLTPEEYVKANYNLCDFEERDINPSELEFFDARSPKALSKSWQKRILTKFTVARKGPLGPYYRVIAGSDNSIFYSDENNSSDNIDSLTGAEFRRLYIALRHYYAKPMVAFKCPIDNEYTYIRILGQMPNREYFYFLLNGWPKQFVADRYNFIMKNELVPQSVAVLEHLGFEIKNGEFYG